MEAIHGAMEVIHEAMDPIDVAMEAIHGAMVRLHGPMDPIGVAMDRCHGAMVHRHGAMNPPGGAMNPSGGASGLAWVLPYGSGERLEALGTNFCHVGHPASFVRVSAADEAALPSNASPRFFFDHATPSLTGRIPCRTISRRPSRCTR